ncbi:MAG: hypothetical protein ACFFBD_29920 [Candidatus Hodarchaeota archaeon]
MANVVTEICKKELRSRFGSKSVFLSMLLTTGIPMLVFIPQLLEAMSQAEPGSEYLSFLLFLVIPVMATTLVGINTFINEIRWKTIKFLLVAPVSEEEIFIGKSLACIIVGLLVDVILSLIVLLSLDRLDISVILLLFVIGPLSVIFTTFIFIIGTSRFPIIAEGVGAIIRPMGGLLFVFLNYLFLKEFLKVSPSLINVVLALIIASLTCLTYFIAKKKL